MRKQTKQAVVAIGICIVSLIVFANIFSDGQPDSGRMV